MHEQDDRSGGGVDRRAKVRENRLRLLAKRVGYQLKKTTDATSEQDGYQLVLVDPRLAVDSPVHTAFGAEALESPATLDDIEMFLGERQAVERSLPAELLTQEGDAWFHRAGDLSTAARIIWAKEFSNLETKPVLSKLGRPSYVHLMGPFFLLAGLAIEAKVKGLRVFQMLSDRERHGKKRQTFKQLRTRDLLRLTADAGLESQLSSEQKDTMRRLTQHVRWAGRYPRPSAPIERLNALVVSTDMEVIETILAMIETAYQEIRTAQRSGS